MNKQSIKKSKQVSVLILTTKLIILLAVIALGYYKIRDPNKFGVEFYNYLVSLGSDGTTILIWIGVLLLMPLNWILEAIKWKKLVSIEYPISLSESLKGVVAGLSLGFITPHAIGDYAGRIGWLKNENKTRFIGSIWLGNVIQMIVTLIFGIFGLSVFYSNSNNSFPIIYAFMAVILTILVGAAFIFFLRKRRKDWLGKAQFYFNILLQYSFKDVLIVLCWATARYAVFSLQFLLILLSLEIQLPAHQLYAGISWIFLLKSIVPSFNFMSDLGVRELSALTFFDLFNVNQSAIVVGSLLLWLVNIVVPVIVGLYFVLRMKILNSK